MSLRSACVALAGFSFAGAVFSQTSAPAGSSTNLVIPLTLERGVPLRLIITKRLPMKVNQPVVARLVDPIFLFDREVAPPGLEVLGRVRELRPVRKWERARALLGGDFTPLHTPVIEFTTLVMKDGRRIPLETSVEPGTAQMVRFAAGGKKKGRVAQAKEAARQAIDTRKRAVIDAVKAPGKMERVRDMVLARLPYHPQSVPAAARFNARLLTPVNFGSATVPASELSAVGDSPAPDSVLHGRLSTELDSRTSAKGSVVEAVLSQPLFDSNHRLVFPEGSRLRGSVVQVKAARRWHRNGQLRFLFQEIEPPESSLAARYTTPRRAQRTERIEGRLEAVEVSGKGDKVRVDSEGGTKTVASPTRFIAPAVTLILAGHGLDNDPIRVHGIRTGAHEANTGGRTLAGGVGFGLIGAVIGHISRPVAAGLGFYGAAWSVYTNLIARGQEVHFAADTPLEIRLGARTPGAK